MICARKFFSSKTPSFIFLYACISLVYSIHVSFIHLCTDLATDELKETHPQFVYCMQSSHVTYRFHHSMIIIATTYKSLNNSKLKSSNVLYNFCLGDNFAHMHKVPFCSVDLMHGDHKHHNIVHCIPHHKIM